jgi:hypothetical protein
MDSFTEATCEPWEVISSAHRSSLPEQTKSQGRPTELGKFYECHGNDASGVAIGRHSSNSSTGGSGNNMGNM